MKKVKFLAMMLAAGMFAACSDALEDAGVENGGGTLPTTGEGYVKVAINMPTTSGAITKAESFDDGLEGEYKVNNGYIVFFKAASTETDPDEKATFVSAYDLGNLSQQDVTSDGQISTLVSTITTAPFVGEENNLYALVILNPSSNITLTGTDEEGARGLKVGDTDITTTSTLSALQTKLANQEVDTYIEKEDQASFTMVNAPLSSKDGNHTVASEFVDQTLVKVTVYKTEEKAAGSDPNQIYVERVVAKVTLSGFEYTNNEYTKEVDNEGSVYDGDKVILEGWALNVTNKSTKLVRDASDIATWRGATYGEVDRFVGITPVATGASQYRIYWAEDGNYDGTGYDNEFNIYVTTSPVGQGETLIDEKFDWNLNAEQVNNNKSFPLYCLENTMNFDQQIKNQTTGVIIKTKYLAKIGNETVATASDFFVCGTDPTKYRARTQSGDNAAIGLLNAMEALFSAPDQITLALKSDANGGEYTTENMNSLLQKVVNDTPTDLTDSEIETIWNKFGKIRYYKNGDNYYKTTLIRHFQESDGVTYEPNEGEYQEKHLGRYGVVRNNWYELKIKSISGPGEPEVDNPGEEIDDDEEGYINCQINVLSWAKRQQDVDL